jgi:hypothetical protein
VALGLVVLRDGRLFAARADVRRPAFVVRPAVARRRRINVVIYGWGMLAGCMANREGQLDERLRELLSEEEAIDGYLRDSPSWARAQRDVEEREAKLVAAHGLRASEEERLLRAIGVTDGQSPPQVRVRVDTPGGDEVEREVPLLTAWELAHAATQKASSELVRFRGDAVDHLRNVRDELSKFARDRLERLKIETFSARKTPQAEAPDPLAEAKEKLLAALGTAAQKGTAQDAKEFAVAYEAVDSIGEKRKESAIKRWVQTTLAGVTVIQTAVGIAGAAYLQVAQHNTPYAATVLVATLGIGAVSKLLGSDKGDKKGDG